MHCAARNDIRMPQSGFPQLHMWIDMLTNQKMVGASVVMSLRPQQEAAHQMPSRMHNHAPMLTPNHCGGMRRKLNKGRQCQVSPPCTLLRTSEWHLAYYNQSTLKLIAPFLAFCSVTGALGCKLNKEEKKRSPCAICGVEYSAHTLKVHQKVGLKCE